MATMRLTLTDRTTFAHSVKLATKDALKRYYDGSSNNRPSFSPGLSINETVFADQLSLREYPNLRDNSGNLQLRLTPYSNEIVQVPSALSESDPTYLRTVQNILGGYIITEHSAGGEATRLGMGFKFKLTPAELVDALAKDPILSSKIPAGSAELIPLTFGLRHMAQFAYDLTNLAAKNDRNPNDVLRSQFMIITLNPKMSDETIAQFVKYKFFGFNPERMLFMVDKLYRGMHITETCDIEFNPSSDLRLYNHGHMVMQETMENELFTVGVDPATCEIKHKPLSRSKVEAILKNMEAKVSYPIEDNDYLTSSLSINSLATAIDLGTRNYRMVMEVLPQSDPPQKGGCWAFDPILGRGVMVESDSGGSHITEGNITALNRNFNIFPHPGVVFGKLADEGLPYLHLMVTEGHLYLQPPQGDLNFLVPTAFVQREGARPINSLKKKTDGPKTLTAMLAQDREYYFREFLRKLKLIGAHLDPKEP